MCSGRGGDNKKVSCLGAVPDGFSVSLDFSYAVEWYGCFLPVCGENEEVSFSGDGVEGGFKGSFRYSVKVDNDIFFWLEVGVPSDFVEKVSYVHDW